MKAAHQVYDTSIGINLLRIRKEKGLSLRNVAANCELGDSNIAKIENG
jgi:transcriptional regulator with XRE-family HTH domain